MQEQGRNHQRQAKTLDRASSLLSTTPSHNTTLEPQLPLLSFHRTAVATGAYNAIDPRRRSLLEAYCTSEVPMGDLRDLAGVSTVPAVRHLITTAVQRVFENLPSEQQAKYKSPREVLHLKTKSLTPVTRRRLSRVLEGKTREFSQTHKDNLSAGASKRWQRYREQGQQTTNRKTQLL